MQHRDLARKYLPQPVVDILRAVKYRYELATFNQRVVTHRYGSHVLEMSIDDRIAAEWYDKDWDLPPEIEFLSQMPIPQAGRIFDLGAHQCLIAMLLGKEVTPAGTVVSVEANRHNAAISRRNLELNGVDNVEVMHALISDVAGRGRADMSFNSRARPGIGGIVGDQVNALSIDDLAQMRGFPDLVYMDIEGFEIAALKGATQTLSRWCYWFIELHGDDLLGRYGARNADILGYFDFQDFAAHLCLETDTKFRPLTEREPLPTERCFLIFAPRSARLIKHGLPDGAPSQQ
ncbi:MAG: FkbM family methyltransferase [Pseudolabrys sp.]|jgi:FkbM family methyltransferase